MVKKNNKPLTFRELMHLFFTIGRTTLIGFFLLIIIAIVGQWQREAGVALLFCFCIFYLIIFERKKR